MLLSPRRPDQPDSGGASSHRRSQQMAGCTPVFGAVALLIGGAGIAIAQTSPETTSRTIELPTMEVTPVPRTIGGTTPSTGPCVAVDIVGHTAGHLDSVAEKRREKGRVGKE